MVEIGETLGIVIIGIGCLVSIVGVVIGSRRK